MRRVFELRVPVLRERCETQYGWACVLPFGFAVVVYLTRLVDRPRVGLRAHELMHVMQARELGWARFVWEYVQEWRRHGYRRNRFEVDADERQNLADEIAEAWGQPAAEKFAEGNKPQLSYTLGYYADE